MRQCRGRGGQKEKTTPPRRFAPPLRVSGGESFCASPPVKEGLDATPSRTRWSEEKTTPPRRFAPPLRVSGGESFCASPPVKEGWTRRRRGRGGRKRKPHHPGASRHPSA